MAFCHMKKAFNYNLLYHFELVLFRDSKENHQTLGTLFHKGYSLAIDDFVFSPDWERFLPFIKMIKFDIVDTPLDTIGDLIKPRSRS